VGHAVKVRIAVWDALRPSLVDRLEQRQASRGGRVQPEDAREVASPLEPQVEGRNRSTTGSASGTSSARTVSPTASELRGRLISASGAASCHIAWAVVDCVDAGSGMDACFVYA
jgi:hypothetical protein